jgi:hypothetical protein
MLHCHEYDPCCSPKIDDAIKTKAINDESKLWTCPECGTEWKPVPLDGPVCWWIPIPAYAVIA